MMPNRSDIADLLVNEKLEKLPFRWVSESEVALPYRGLLCHERDMTSTLASFHDGEVKLEVLREERGASYVREVVLRVSGKVVEFGVISIQLENFSEELREVILAGARPLGALLNESGMRYLSRPQGYLEIEEEKGSLMFFESLGRKFQFGRYNVLLDDNERVLARIIEILPLEE